jgi:PiT family inorganic phosphate transporter
MATSIATGAPRPKVAVAIAGCLNLVGAFLATHQTPITFTYVVNLDTISSASNVGLS